MRKKAFSLAEILISLMVIAIVYVLTVPAILSNIQAYQLRSALRKTYGVANQAYAQASVENGGFSPYTTGTTMSYTKFNALKSKLNVAKECPYNTNALGNCWSKTPVGAAAAPNGCAGMGTTWQYIHESFVTADGVYWMLYTYSSTTGSDAIMVDVNGEKPPNDWGKDVFAFMMNSSDIRPNGISCIEWNHSLLHNDGSAVDINEFIEPLKQ